MTELEQIIYRAIVDCVSDLIVERMQNRSQTALVLFTGTTRSLPDAARSLRELCGKGWNLRPALSQSAQELFGEEELAALCGGVPFVKNPVEELQSCTTLLIPALSSNTAAKVAWGIQDSIPSAVIAGALERGLPVIAAKEGCVPGEDTPMAAAYRERLLQNAACLTAYGVQLVPAAELSKAALGNPAGAPSALLQSLPGVQAAPAQKAIFGHADAVACTPGQVLTLPNSTLVTPLAADELRQRGVCLKKQ